MKIKMLGILSQNDIDYLVGYISYRIQLALYMDINDNEISWNEYIYFIRGHEVYRDALKKELSKALKQYKFRSSDFENADKEINWFDDYTEKSYDFSALFEGNEGRDYINRFMLKSQVAYYFYLLKQKIIKTKRFYTRRQFVHDVQNNNEVYKVLRRALLNGLAEANYESLNTYFK